MNFTYIFDFFLMENHKTIFNVSYDIFQLTKDETNIAGFYRVQTCCASLLCKLLIFVLYNQSRETKQKHVIFQLANAEKSIIMKSIEYSNNKVVI